MAKKTGSQVSLFFKSFQNLRKLVYSVLTEGKVERNEGDCTSQAFSRCQALYWTLHITFDLHNSPQSSCFYLWYTEKITWDSAYPKALHSLCLRSPGPDVKDPQVSIQCASSAQPPSPFSLTTLCLLKIRVWKGGGFSFLCFTSFSLAL